MEERELDTGTVGPPACPTTSGAVGASLAGLQAFSLRRGSPGNADRVRELKQKLAAQTFDLVVFGEFKRGKTTFINALLGDEFLPTAVVPLTSVVTLLRYTPDLAIEVEFLDGRVGKIGRHELADYVTERGNPENVKGVKAVLVGLPCDLLRNGMQLVDTPGVGSVYDHNTAASRDFLSHVDGAILLVASDPPISRGECEFLLEMRPHVARLFVVQNKIDQLRPEDLQESLDFTAGVLHQVLGDEAVRIFAVSAREALEARLSNDPEAFARSGLEAFEYELRRFQGEEQTQVLAVSVVRNALQVAEDEKLGLSLERQALRMSVEEIERRFAEFMRQRDEILAQREDDTVLIRAAARKVIQRTLQHDYDEERARQAPLLRQRLTDWAEQQGAIPPGELLQRANAVVRELLFEALGEWRRSEERRLEQALTATLERFTVRTNEVLAAIYDSAREVFELPPRSVETVGYLAAPSRFLWRDWDWEPRYGLGGAPLVRFLPGARDRVLRAALEKLLQEHDKGCGRLRSDFAARAQMALDDYVRSVNRGLGETLSGIDRAIGRVLAQQRSVTEDVAQAEERVAQESEELAAIMDELRSSLPEEPGHEA
jgi:GTPase SAR1 family protein